MSDTCPELQAEIKAEQERNAAKADLLKGSFTPREFEILSRTRIMGKTLLEWVEVLHTLDGMNAISQKIESEKKGDGRIPWRDETCTFCGREGHWRPDCPDMVPPTMPKLGADPVNHPPHYKDHPSGVECITITEHFNFNIGNAIKYCWRAGKKDKDKQIQDLKKAAWYVNREIERLSRDS